MKRFVLLIFAFFSVYVAWAQTYDVDYRDMPVEKVCRDLKERTGYEFIYQKQTLEGVSNVTCTYKNATLRQLLDRIFYEACQLQYEIVNKTIVLRKREKDTPWFKKLVVGVVKDEQDEPIVGAVLMLRDTKVSAVTDLDGQFSIFVEGKDPVLDVSCIGMLPLSVKVKPNLRKGSSAFLLLTMQPDVKMLEEVMVTGYQNVKRENATGAYQTISGNSLEKRYTGDVMNNLEGRVPGLVKNNNGMTDEGEASLTIRGAGSFQAKTNPLVVVDGLPIEGGLNSVNPYNIQSISVLKDAAAASIYGARASNGVIVITTKRADSDRLSIEFNADLNISENRDYSHMGWANAEQLIELEHYNFTYVKNSINKKPLNNLKSYYQNNPYALSPVLRLMMANYMGDLATDEMQAELSALSRNDYRKEWQDVMERPQITQQYNLAIRNQGKHLNSNFVVNYLGDNEGTPKEYSNTLTFSYQGSMELFKRLNLDFGTNFIARRGHTHINQEYNRITAFAPYYSMYNADGSRADMEAGAYLYEPSLSNPALGLKSESFNPLDEIGRNFNRMRENNIRSYVHATLKLLEGWTASGQFQYEDIYSKNDAYYEAESYEMRHLYNLYTATDGTHHLPDAGLLKSRTAEGAYYTFRAQTDYSHVFKEKHSLNALLGFEYRQTSYKNNAYALVGYDEDSQTNNMGNINLGQLMNLQNSTSALGSYYYMVGAPDGNDYTSSDVLHRYYSVYFNGNYLYDHRYAASFSYRVDKTDLFGADPKFRGRPLWSVGLSWNVENEQFMQQVKWLNSLKLRTSYGLTGNIDQSVSSYLTANVSVNELTGDRVAILNTPPNDQLRWEKTASFNVGADFAMWKGRLSGALDFYYKKGSDLLTVTDLDPTTGWSSLTINNGKAVNKGVELQLNGIIVQAANRKKVGVNLSANLSYNHNEVTAINHEPTSGSEALRSTTYSVGHPIHSLYSYKYAGVKTINGIQYFGWEDHQGKVHYTDIETEDFTPADVVYSGSLDPKVVAGITPEITWRGFTLSAMLCYYGGHVMRARSDEWTCDGSQFGYNGLAVVEAVPASYLNFWKANGEGFPANGYLGSTNVVGDGTWADANVVPADYMKLRYVALGYDFNGRVCRSLRVRSLRLRAQVNNLLTWHRNDRGIDPEANDPVSGTAYVNTPRSYTMSLNITF